MSVSRIVNALKGVSSRRYGQAGFTKPKNGKALWSPSYFAVSVGGAPIEALIYYIKNQSRPRRTGLYPINFGQALQLSLEELASLYD